MAQYINKDALVAEITKRVKEGEIVGRDIPSSAIFGLIQAYKNVLSFIDTLEVKEVEGSASIAYVVTRCEEHSDYVEKVFFDENKAQEYCDQFKGNENEYARHITRVKVTL